MSLDTWKEKFGEIWGLITTSPENFRGGGIWDVICNIHGGLQAVAYALLVLFCIVGIAKNTMNFSELRRPEQAVRFFIRFAIAKIIVTYSMDFLMMIFRIIQGIIVNITDASGGLVSGNITVPALIRQKMLECNFLESIPLWIVSVIAAVLVTVLAFVLILTVYGRFFQLYIYTAVAPLPLSTFAGEGTSAVGRHFLKSYAGVCLQGAVIILCCIIYSVFASSPPVVFDGGSSAVQLVWAYMGEFIFDLLVLVGAVRMSERIVREMIGY